jgi:uncharacterized protein (TIGR02001 family)
MMIIIAPTVFAQQSAGSGPRLYGDIKLTTDYVEKGLTQTDKNPSVIAGFGYWFGPQGRIGVQASNVEYEAFDSTMRADVFGEYKFLFTPNADLKLKTSYSQYSPAAGRNNLLTGLDQNLSTYHFLFEHDDNFEGTKTRRDWVAFHKDWNLDTSYLFSVTVGYSMLQKTGLKNYIDTRIGASYASTNFFAGIYHCYNSKASQFTDGQGDMAFLIEGGVKF